MALSAAACAERAVAPVGALAARAGGPVAAESPAANAAEPTALARFEYRAVRMGVEARIVVFAFAAGEGAPAEAARAAFERIARLEDVLSDWRAASEISRLSDAAGRGPIPVSEDLFDALARARAIAEATDGAFDPTIGALVSLWRESRASGRLPSDAERSAALATAGWRDLSLDPSRRTASLARAGTRLDLGGIGKGLAASEALALLRAPGFPRALVALAGDVVAGDPPIGEEGWTVAIDVGLGRLVSDPAPPEPRADRLTKPTAGDRPGGESTPAPVAHIRDAAISTSGDAEQSVEIDGVRYSHVVDPSTGLGLTRRTAACVVAPDGATADALATALCVLGVERGRDVLERFDGARAMIVERSESATRAWRSDGFPLPDHFAVRNTSLGWNVSRATGGT